MYTSDACFNKGFDEDCDAGLCEGFDVGFVRPMVALELLIC